MRQKAANIQCAWPHVVHKRGANHFSRNEAKAIRMSEPRDAGQRPTLLGLARTECKVENSTPAFVCGIATKQTPRRYFFCGAAGGSVPDWNFFCRVAVWRTQVRTHAVAGNVLSDSRVDRCQGSAWCRQVWRPTLSVLLLRKHHFHTGPGCTRLCAVILDLRMRDSAVFCQVCRTSFS